MSLFDKVVHLDDYDLIVASVSGGKDSAAMMLNLRRRLDEIGIGHPPIEAIHVHIVDFDWPDTAHIVRMQCDILGIPLTIMQTELLPKVRRRLKWPSPAQRWCTSDCKRAEIDKFIRAKSREHGSRRILSCEGIRSEESKIRGMRDNLHFLNRLTTADRNVFTYYPIFRASAEFVWSEVKNAEFPLPMCYQLGFKRCGCPFCIYADRKQSDLASSLPILRPLYDSIRRLECETGHVLYPNRPWPYPEAEGGK